MWVSGSKAPPKWHSLGRRPGNTTPATKEDSSSDLMGSPFFMSFLLFGNERVTASNRLTCKLDITVVLFPQYQFIIQTEVRFL